METADWVTAAIGALAILLSAFTYIQGRALNRVEKAQDRQQRRMELLQGSKEQVARQAMSVADSGLPVGEEGRQLLRSLLLAAIFENSGRAWALVISALRSRYDENSDLIENEIQRIENDLGVMTDFGVGVDDKGDKVRDFDVRRGQDRIRSLREVLAPGGAGSVDRSTGT